MRIPPVVYLLGQDKDILTYIGLMAAAVRSIPINHPERLTLTRKCEYFLGAVIKSNWFEYNAAQFGGLVSYRTFKQWAETADLVENCFCNGLKVPSDVWATQQKVFLRRLRAVSAYINALVATGAKSKINGDIWNMHLEGLSSRTATAKGLLRIAEQQLRRDATG